MKNTKIPPMEVTVIGSKTISQRQLTAVEYFDIFTVFGSIDDSEESNFLVARRGWAFNFYGYVLNFKISALPPALFARTLQSCRKCLCVS